MVEKWKLAVIIGAILLGSTFAVGAFAQTVVPSSTTVSRGSGMMGRSQLGTSSMGGGMMGTATGGHMDYDDMARMMGSDIGWAWQNMTRYCGNMMSQFASWLGNATLP